MRPNERRLRDTVLRQAEADVGKPLSISVMGQTGVGKSSLINALFHTKLTTDPVRPTTKEMIEVSIEGKSGGQLLFYDLPGLGETAQADERYLALYRERLFASDVVLWALHSDNRAVSLDQLALDRLLRDIPEAQRSAILSKLTIVLTKADLLTPPAWIFVKDKHDGFFNPSPTQRDILALKERYYREALLRPYGTLMISRTYNDVAFDLGEPPFQYDQDLITYHGYLDEDDVVRLKQRYPRYAAVFDRLYANYQVITCSALFRFNLTQLLVVILNKLSANAVLSFNHLVSGGSLNRMPVEAAKSLGNIVVLDQKRGRIIFDLRQVKL